jgi:mRNA interferase MazF
MSVRRGDVVLLDYPFASGGGGKVRPALVVQNDVDNGRLVNTIVAMITSRTQRAANVPTQLLIDISTPEGRQSGLVMDSAINCVNLFTVGQSKILRTLGRLSPSLISKTDDCLKAALGVS